MAIDLTATLGQNCDLEYHGPRTFEDSSCFRSRGDASQFVTGKRLPYGA